jgi:hypothetical protein
MSDTLTTWLFGLTVFAIVKWLLIIGLTMYLAFAVIIVRQVGVMSEALEDPYNELIKMFAWAHLALTVLLIIISIVIL